MSTSRILLTTAAATLSVALAACSSSGTAGTPTASPTGLSGVTAAATGGRTSTAAGAGCGGGSAAAAKAALGSYGDLVTDVSVVGGCHVLGIATSMASADQLSASSTKAVAICRKAAKVGYVDGVSSITVTWTDGHEAAVGEQGMDCIPG